MAEKHFNPATPEGRAPGNVIPFRASPLRGGPPRPPDISICEAPLYVCKRVLIANLLHGLESGGLCLRFDRPSGRFVIDDKPVSG
jgi:hypothetical protein